MKQGTTYPIILTIPGIDLSGAEWVIVSIKPDRKPPIEFGREDMLLAVTGGDTTLTVTLTEAQSVALNPGGAVIDANWMLDGVRGGCVPRGISVTDTLLRRVVE